MPQHEDELTKAFKRLLEESSTATSSIGSGAYSPTLDSPGFYGSGTDYESALSKISAMERPAGDAAGYETNLLKALGKGLWSLGEVASFGVTDLLFPEIAREMAPKTTSEEWLSAIGSVIGFASPMGLGRAVLGKAVSRFSKYGATKMSKKFADDATEVLLKDKKFLEWAQKEGVDASIFARRMAEPIAHDIGVIGTKKTLQTFAGRTGKQISSDIKLRTEFTENLLKNTSNILQDTARRRGASLSSKTLEEMNTVVGQFLGSVSVKGWKGVWKEGVFPMASLQERMAFAFGGKGGKVAQVAASMVEEAILFTAAELPINYAQMYAHADMNFNEWFNSPLPGKAMAHAFVLGSILGLVRFIPGGGEKGIISSAFGPKYGAIATHLKRRSRYNSYNPSIREHREVLVNEGRRILEQRGDMTKTLRYVTKKGKVKGNITESNIGQMITGTPAEATAGAASIQSWLVDIERAFYKQWWPDFAKGAPKDLWGSKYRMLAGSLAFNFENLFGPQSPNESWDNKLFHILLGAFLTRKHHPLKWYSSSGKWNKETQKHEGAWVQSDKNRPYLYGDLFDKTDRYLQIMGTPPSENIFVDLLNKLKVSRTMLRTPKDHPDMMSIIGTEENPGLLRKLNLIIERNTESNIHEDGVQYNEVYDLLKQYVEHGALYDLAEQRMKRTEELSPEELTKTLDALANLKLETIIKNSLQNSSGGIHSMGDVQAAFAGASHESYRFLMENEEIAGLTGYDKIVEMETGENPQMILAKEQSTLPVLREVLLRADTHTGVDYYRIQDFVRNFDRYDGILWRIDKTSTIELGREQIIELLGKEEGGDGGILGEFDRISHEFVTKNDPYYAEMLDNSAIIGIGHPVTSDFISRSAMFESVDRAWRMLGTLDQNQLSLWKDAGDDTIKGLSNVNQERDGHSGRSAQSLMTKIFVKDGQVVTRVEVLKGKTELSVDDPNVVFAKALHSVLQRNPTLFQTNELTEGEITSVVDVSTIRSLRKIFDANGLYIFEKSAGLPNVLEYLQEYVMDRSLADFVRADGSPMTSSDREKMRIFYDDKLLTSTFETYPIIDVLDSLTDMILPYRGDHASWVGDFANELSKVGTAKIKKHLDDMVVQQYMTSHQLETLGVSAVKLAERLGITLPKGYEQADALTIVMKDLLDRYARIMKQYIKTKDGKGFIKPMSHSGKAIITEENLLNLVTSLEATETRDIIRTYNDLRMDVASARMSEKSESVKKFLSSLEGALVGAGGRGNIPRTIKALMKSGFYNKKQRRFDFDRKGLTKEEIERKMVEVSKLLAWETSIVPSEVVIAHTYLDSKGDLKPAFEVDKPVSRTLEKYIEVYNLEYKSLPGLSLSEVFKGDMDRFDSLESFTETMKSKARIKKDDEIYIPYNEWGESSKEDFNISTIHLYNQIIARRKVRRIIIIDEDAFYADDVVSESGMYVFFRDILGIGDNFVHIDLTLRDSQGYVDGRSNKTARDHIIRVAATKNAMIKADYKETIPGMGVDMANQGLTDTYYTIVLGDQSAGYGISVYNADIVLNKFVKWVANTKVKHGRENEKLFEAFEKKINEISEGADVDLATFMRTMGAGTHIELPKYGSVEIIEVKTKEGEPSSFVVKDANNKTHDVSIEEISGNISTRHLKATDPKYASNHLQYMVSMMWGEHNLLGSKWYQHVTETMGNNTVAEGQQVAKYMRRIGLDANKGALTLTPDYLLGAASVLGKSDSGVPIERRNILIKDLRRMAKDIEEGGGTRLHILNDESSDMFSTKNQLQRSVEAEWDLPGADTKIWDYWKQRGGDFDSEGRMRGGRKDDTTTNSVVYISNRFLEVLKALLGVSHSEKVGNIKPIIWNNNLLIGKTMFTASHNWHDYLGNNKIDMVMFETAAKHIGLDYAKRVIKGTDFSDATTIEELRQKVFEDRVINLPINSIKIVSTVAAEHNAAIPYQIGTEIVSANVANDFYDWLFAEGVTRFENKSNEFFRNSTTDKQTAWAQRLIHDIGDSDYSMVSAAQTWINSGGHPFAHWLMGTIRQKFKKNYIEQSGLIVPKSRMGGQSALIPSEYFPGSDHYLRNSIFSEITDAEGNTKRFQVTYGQISLPEWAASRPFNPNELGVIEHRPGKKDTRVPWDKDKHGSLEGLTRIGEAHDILVGKNEDNRVANAPKGVNQFVTALGSVYTFEEGAQFGSTRRNKKRRPEHPDFGLKNASSKTIYLHPTVAVGLGGTFGELNKTVAIKPGEGIFAPEFMWTEQGPSLRGKIYGGSSTPKKGYIPLEVWVNKEGKIYKHHFGNKITKILKDAEPRDDIVTYEIATVSSRQPSKSISDKVIVGIKDFNMTGNAARINSSDLLYRLEGDYDVDKINYWWDTPKSVLNIWDENAPKISSVEPFRKIDGTLNIGREANSVKGLDWTKPESQWDYNESIATAALQMGKEVNMRRIIQYLKYYTGKAGMDIYNTGDALTQKGGFSLKIGDVGRIVLNWRSMDKLENTLTRDIQEIIDSNVGYDKTVHSDGWEDRILFGLEGDSEYPGLFKFEQYDSGAIRPDKGRGEWRGAEGNLQGKELYKDIVKVLVRPYRTILQLSSGVYDFGKAQSVRYDDMLSYIQTYKSIMKNLNGYLYGRLLSMGHDRKSLDSVFSARGELGGRRMDVVGWDAAALRSDNFEGMLPYDRVMFSLASSDKMIVDPPANLRGNPRSLADFERFYDDYFMGENEQDALNSMVNLLSSDIRLLGELNRVQIRIDRLENARRSATRKGFSGAADHIEGDVVRLKKMLGEINEKIVSDEKVAPKIKQLVQSQVEKQIIRTGFYNGERIKDKNGNGIKQNKRYDWVVKNRKRIGESLWNYQNGGKSAIRFRTINDNEYLSSMIFHRILKNVIPIVDGSTFPNDARLARFEDNVIDFKKRHTKEYMRYFEGKRSGDLQEWTDLDRISNLFLQELHDKVTKYDEIVSGLGRVFLWKVMIPEAEPLTYTWFNGRISEGFEKTSPIFVKLGMRYLASYTMEGPPIISEMARQFSALYGGYHSNFREIDGFGLKADDVSMLALEINSLNATPAAFLADFRGVTDSTPVTEGKTAEVLASGGMEDSYTLDYLSYHASAPERAVIMLRDALVIRHRPEFADGYDGDLSRIATHSSRWDKRHRNIGLFIGNSLAKRIVKMKYIPGVGAKFGGGDNVRPPTTDTLKRINKRHIFCD